MKYRYTITTLLAITGTAAFVASPAAWAGTHKRASAPLIITPAAVPNGSNWSRAPFPAARPQNDVLPPTGEAFSQNMAPNTPASTPMPLAPAVPKFAILEPRVAPGLTPTGHPTTSAAMALDPARLDPALRNTSFDGRDELVDGVRVRVRESEATVAEFRRSEPEMSSEGRSQFDALRDEVTARRKALEHSTRAAANASSANWESARAQLAADYDAYADALARMDAAVGVPTIRHR